MLSAFVYKYDPELSSRQYGVELSRLTSEERTVPQLVEKLINYIEMHGLYTEGIYRKSGSTNKIKELRQGLDTGETDTDPNFLFHICRYHQSSEQTFPKVVRLL